MKRHVLIPLTTALALVLLASACATTTHGRPSLAARVLADSLARLAVLRERALDPSTIHDRSIGVPPLTVVSDDSTLAPLGYGLADLLINDLARSGQLEVVERMNIDALFRELRLRTLGVVDTTDAPRLGRLLGARRIVVGNLVAAPASGVRIDAQIADARSTEVQSVAGQAASVDAILDAEKSLAFQLFTALGVNLTPGERATIEERPTRNLAALLAFSRGVRAEAVKDFSGAIRDYREAATLDPSFTLANQYLRQARETSDGARILTSQKSQLARAGSLVTDAVNSPALPGTSDVVNPSFDSAKQRTTIVVIIRIP
jgi:TolB-like protein